MAYKKTQLTPTMWVITSEDNDFNHPKQACTFAFDTETLTYFDGKIYDSKTLFRKIARLSNDQRRKRIFNKVWSWQCYDEVNGFFMTNDFMTWLQYQVRCRYHFGWCYNATFDFAQIDYQLLSVYKDLFNPHTKGKDTKGQAWTYQSLHNDMGARYAYKLWIEYHNENRHDYVHSIEYRDFMKLIVGGLGKLLQDLDVKDNNGHDIRKLKMDYQAVEPTLEALSDADISYCENDVKGLYFAIKKFNDTIEEQSNNECHIFGDETNIMTAGGFAKKELLRSMYPDVQEKYRLKRFQEQHPISAEQDEYLRQKYLYRGGISYVNEKYRGKLILQTMYRYDVNSEYPYAMTQIRDLVGKPFKKTLTEWLKMPLKERDSYECAYLLTSVMGRVKPDKVGLWYNPFKKCYQDIINEEGDHLIFERELNEISQWYDDFEFSCDTVILWKRGDYSYRKFVEDNYAVKEQASRDKNATLKTTAKLKLNSSYGKLAERLIRELCHYEVNPETGAIHCVKDGQEDSERSRMNVAVGALITSYARTFIMGKIREITKGNVKQYFIYIDTDSVHSLMKYDDADPYKIGGLKCEMICDGCKYLLPKTYIDIGKINKGYVGIKDFEIHSKGINIFSIMSKFKGKRVAVKTLDKAMSYGSKYKVLVAMNVKGGKVLLPTWKYLARAELAPKDVIYSNADGAMLIER